MAEVTQSPRDLSTQCGSHAQFVSKPALSVWLLDKGIRDWFEITAWIYGREKR